MFNKILLIDSYKFSHYLQLPEKLSKVSSYGEARYSTFPEYKEVLYFGMQMYLKQYLSTPLTMNDIDIAEELITSHGEPFNRKGFEKIVNVYNGFLPLKIYSLPEGSVVPFKIPLFRVDSNDNELPELGQFIETSLMRGIWYPTTVATISREIKKVLMKYADESGTPLSEVLWKLHDFGARGVSSEESAMIGGISHLVNFFGTDTTSALIAGRKYYNEKMAGYSIPAAEHFTVTVWGKENEQKAYENMLRQFAKPGSLVAVVSDSYDIYHAVEKIWGANLRQQVIESGATVVIRPDSGNPLEVPIEVIKTLMGKVGYITNKKGFDVLPSSFRVIQGDGINNRSINGIIDNLRLHKLALSNIAFGMGGGLLQQVNRDTFGFAMKASYAEVNGIERDVSKNPIGDSDKASKKGKQVVYQLPNESGQLEYRSTKESLLPNGTKNLMKLVYDNGKILVNDSFTDIRNRAWNGNFLVT